MVDRAEGPSLDNDDDGAGETDGSDVATTENTGADDGREEDRGGADVGVDDDDDETEGDPVGGALGSRDGPAVTW